MAKPGEHCCQILYFLVLVYQGQFHAPRGFTHVLGFEVDPGHHLVQFQLTKPNQGYVQVVLDELLWTSLWDHQLGGSWFVAPLVGVPQGLAP